MKISEEFAKKIYGEPINLFRFPKSTTRQGLLGCTDFINTDIVLSAYLQGIFPWFSDSEGEDPLWWSPDPRFVLYPDQFHIPKSLKKEMKKLPFTYSMDRAFTDVIKGCSLAERPGQDGTWIGNRMIEIYSDIHKKGIAHSIEVWHEEKLVGGLYGLLIGKIFFGESMFSLESGASKSAFVLFEQAFENAGGKLIDSQVYTDNLARFGAVNISREAFLKLEEEYIPQKIEKNLFEEFENICSFSHLMH